MNTFQIIILIVCGAFMLLNFRHDIHMLQQNSYRIDRYWKWLNRSGDVGSATRMVLVCVLFLLFSTLLSTAINAIIAAGACIALGVIELRRKYKKPLVFTPRVRRIYGVCAFLSVAAVLSLALTVGSGGSDAFLYYTGGQVTLGILLIICIFSWAFAILAVFLLKPVEKAIGDRYRNEAVAILQSMPELKVIGITGSYGKTSTKHYLHRILSEHYDVLMTPGSYNTPMGVIRTVREMMKPYNQIFICEMGAKQVGDIKEICDMVHPQIGIVTAVGPMHLESFKSIENVQRTKFELVDALPADGLAVVNDDFPYVASRKVEGVECIRYAISATKAAAFVAEDIRYSPAGTEMTVRTPEGEKLKFTTRLVGECNVSNLLAAIIVALRLEVPVDKIRYAVASIEQVEHRLNMKRTPGGVTIIDDAFNSNPTGSAMALDVLAMMTGGQRIIVTPGMIELGDRQAELNQKLGEKIARCADVAVVVGTYNREAIVAGIQSVKGSDIKLHKVNSFAESQLLLAKILKPGDTVLYENDLPDTFK